MQTGTWIVSGILAYVFLLHRTECAITAWTKPEINTASGSGTLDEKINDGVTTGSTTGITIEATTNDTISAYTKVSQTPPSPELAIDNSGSVTVTSGTVSYSTSTSLTMVVNATDGTDTVTANVTINVNAAPAISTHSSTPCIADVSTAGTDLIDLAANDSNSGTTFTWAIASGANGDFKITSNGVIEVETGKTLAMATMASYTLVITAADDSSTPLIATTTVTASVQTTCPSSSASVAISLMTLLAALVVIKLF